MNNNLYITIKAHGDQIFQNPLRTYDYESIISGCPVQGKNGSITTMYAAASNTWRGFHKLDKEAAGAGIVFIRYFIENSDYIIRELSNITDNKQLDKLEDSICMAIKTNLKNIRQDMLVSYNKIRKPVDLYIEHIVSMATELDSYRKRLIPLLYLALDSQMFQSTVLFTDEELNRFKLSRMSSFKDIYRKNTYSQVQDLLQRKADSVSNVLGSEFHRIYFDLLWNERYKKDSTNLFYSNLPSGDVQHIKNTTVEVPAVPMEKNHIQNIQPYYNNSNIVDRINSALKFADKFGKANTHVHDLFIKLIQMVDSEGIINKATNTPDYRLVKKGGRVNYCLITFSPDALRIHLQRNSIGLASNVLKLTSIKDGRYNGRDWVEILVRNDNELAEAFRLLLIVYKNSL